MLKRILQKKFDVAKQNGRLTAYKREIKDFPKFAYRRTSFIHGTLSEMGIFENFDF